jgi:hypothetical protein
MFIAFGFIAFCQSCSAEASSDFDSVDGTFGRCSPDSMYFCARTGVLVKFCARVGVNGGVLDAFDTTSSK